MKRNLYIWMVVWLGVITSGVAHAQLVGDQIFLQGRYLEVGVAPNGSWGNTMPVPAGYHTHTWATVSLFGYADPLTGVAATGDGIDFSIDVGHDGWTAGSPVSPPGVNCCFYGSFFLPGTPFDGWAVQMNGIRGDAYYTSGPTGGFATPTGSGATLNGTNVAYQYTPGSSCGPFLSSSSAGYWSGTYTAGGGTLSIRSMNRVDTNASWDLVTVTFKNTGATTITDLYYLATGDPDNDVTIGGSYSTDNHICYQNDAQHRVEVYAYPGSGTHPDDFTGMCAKDCRAKAIIYQSWPSAIDVLLSDMYAGTTSGAGLYTSRIDTTTTNQDWAYGLVFKLGNLAPGDSTRISFAWIFTDSTAVDSAFQEPKLNVNCDIVPNNDTFNACGLTTVPVNIVNPEWGLTEWVWTPATALSTTRGYQNSINVSALGGMGITYTITGTDTTSCHNFKFTLYLPPCNASTSNSPDDDRICVGDTLKLQNHGDSTGATYLWYGPGMPGPIRGAAQYIDIPNTVYADTGWYYCVKFVGTSTDTSRTHVLFKHQPVVTATYGAPVCSGNTLHLYSTPDSVGETWDWRGPDGWISTASDPDRVSAPTTYSGVYTVVTTLNGCKDSGTVSVTIDPTPAIPTVSSSSPVCQHDTMFLFSACDTPGVTYSWTGPSGFSSTDQNPFMADAPLTAGGIYSVTVTKGICFSTNSTLVDVRLKPVPVLGSNSPICTGSALNLTTTAPAGSTFDWTGPYGFNSGLQYPTINPAITANSGTYSVVVTLAGCPSDTMMITVAVDTTPESPVLTTNSPGAPGPTICEGDTLKFTSFSATAFTIYHWSGPAGFDTYTQNPNIPGATAASSGVYTLVASIGTCSATASISATVTPTPPIAITSNTPICSGENDTLKLHAIGDPGSSYNWTGPYTFSSNAQDPVRTPAKAEYSGVYQVTVTTNNCHNSASHTVVINQTPDVPWVKWLTYCQYYDAPYLQAVGSNLLWFSSSSGGTGIVAPPKPSTDVVGYSFYYVNQTVNDCPGPIDSIRVTVNPKPTVTVTDGATVCPHDSVAMIATNFDDIAYYKWSPQMYLSDTVGAGVVAHPETDMNYMVITSNVYGCTDTATVAITVKASAVIHMEDSVRIYPGESYQIEPVTNCSIFSWSPSGGLSDKYIANPLATPEYSTRYVLTGITEWGCRTQDTINIIMSDDAIFNVPNAFAPGGVNSKFKVGVRGLATLRYFRVYDRWGVLVYDGKDIADGWDGTYKGVPQPVGVYVYEVSAVSTNGKIYNKAGNVTLLR